MLAAELVGNTLGQQLGGKPISHTIFDDIPEDTGHDCRVISPVSGEDDPNVSWRGQIWQPRASAHLLIQVLRREGERVIDAI